MQIKHQPQDAFYNDFLPLIAEIECGAHYNPSNEQHVEWLKRRLTILYLSGATAICAYTDEGKPIGFLLLVLDKGLIGECFFGKKAVIAMFGLFKGYRSQGIGPYLIAEAERYVTANGGECIYVDTYAANSGAIRFYVRCGFIPVAYHPGENGVDDEGQVYLWKRLAAEN